MLSVSVQLNYEPLQYHRYMLRTLSFPPTPWTLVSLSLFAELLHTAHPKEEKAAERSAVSASSADTTRQAARVTQQTAQVRKVGARVEEKPFKNFEILPPRKPAEREPVTGEQCSTGKLCREEEKLLDCALLFNCQYNLLAQCLTSSFVFSPSCTILVSTSLYKFSCASSASILPTPFPLSSQLQSQTKGTKTGFW